MAATSPELVAGEVGLPADVASAALHTLERNGTLLRIRDPLRERRDCYDFADPHLRFWLTVVAGNRVRPGRRGAADVWSYVRDHRHGASASPACRWESVVRQHISRREVAGLVPLVSVGASLGLEVVGIDADRRVAVIGRVSVDDLGVVDLQALEERRQLLGVPDAQLVLASTVRVDAAAVAQGAVAVTPADVYGVLPAGRPRSVGLVDQRRPPVEPLRPGT